jgi:hypothetical protein
MAPLKDEDMIDAKRIEDTNEDATLGDRSLFDPVEPYCAPGFKGIFASYYVALCALFSALGKSFRFSCAVDEATNINEADSSSVMIRVWYPSSWSCRSSWSISLKSTMVEDSTRAS